MDLYSFERTALNAFTTILLFPFQPRRVILAHERTRLREIYIIHWLGLLAVATVLVTIDMLAVDLAISLRRSVTERIISNKDAAAGAVIVALLVEVVFVLVATAMTCWAGADEPLGRTWRHALKVSWLYAAHLTWVAAAFGVFVLGSLIDFNVEREQSLAVFLAAVVIWSIVSYLRALTAPRATAPPDHHPMCEWCGYNLSHSDPAGRCSECGKEVRESLDPVVRPARGADEIPLGRLASAAWFEPARAFRAFPAHQRSGRAVRILILSLSLGGVAGTMLFVGGLMLGSGGAIGGPPIFTLIALVTVFGSFIAWALFLFASIVATLSGLYASRYVGRNRFTAALHVVTLTSGLFPLWAGLAMLALGCGIGLANTGRGAGIYFGCWGSANIVVAILYVKAVSRRMRFVQYANR